MGREKKFRKAMPLFFKNNKKDTGKAKEPKKFGTFGGVFTPTLLTILGVIMYLRLGWVI